MSRIHIPVLRTLEVRTDNDRVVLLEEGKAILNIPWEMASNLGRMLIAKSKIAEEQAKALDIIKDQAIIQRAGFKFGLTNDPDIQDEAMKEAQYNRKLRRAMPGGVKSKGKVGTPTLIKKQPTNNGGKNAKI